VGSLFVSEREDIVKKMEHFSFLESSKPGYPWMKAIILMMLFIVYLQRVG
jgi:hypothetical protein